VLFACAQHHGKEIQRGATSTAAASPAPKPLSVTERRSLRAVIDATLPAGGMQSLCVLDERGVQVYGRNATLAIPPASAQKVVIAASALADLGTNYRFVTTIGAERAPEGGVLHGNLWLVGSADPVLVSNDLRGGVKIIAAQGVQDIRGGVRVDATFLSGPERNPLWEASDAQYGFSAATSAISLDQDTIEVHATPSSEGLRARVWLEPPSGIVSVTGDVLTVAAGLPTTFDFQPLNRANAFGVSGQVAADERKAILYVPIRGIPLYVGDVFTRMLLKRGIRVAQPPSAGIAPRLGVVLWKHRSMPLLQIVSKMLFESNNHLAEQLLRALGRVSSGVGSDQAGVAAERALLRRYGIPRTGLVLVDGSGLSANNRASASTLARLLDDDRRHRGARLYNALPRAGIEGTVRYYDVGAARGRVRAKSGHLAGVASLAGYVFSRHSRTFAFAFLFANGEDADNVDSRITRAVQRLADF